MQAMPGHPRPYVGSKARGLFRVLRASDRRWLWGMIEGAGFGGLEREMDGVPQQALGLSAPEPPRRT